MENILDHPEHDQDINIKEWKLFIGKEAEYYIPKWLNIRDGSIISFNIASFVLGVFWMLYRKMYLASLIWIVVIIIYGFIEEEIVFALGLEDALESITRISNVIFSSLVAIFGNWIYFKSSERKISKLKNQGLGEIAYEEALQRAGGTSLIPPIVAVFAFVIFMYFFLDFVG